MNCCLLDIPQLFLSAAVVFTQVLHKNMAATTPTQMEEGLQDPIPS